jgi:WD40 repeat protein
MATGKETSKLEGHTALVLSVAISPDGKTIVSGSCDNTIR